MPRVDLERLKERASQALAAFTTGQKVTLAAVLVAVLLGGYAFTSWASKPAMAPLFTGLEAQDAASVTEKLDAAGVRYELTDGGRSILVPRSQLYDLRLKMSAAGLPASSTSGYALLDKQGITTSEFRQRVDYQRALEGELTRTIQAIDGVSAATVHLVIPKDDLFADDERRPTASVLVKTAPGKKLTSGQAQAIVHLVSSSVEGLQPGDVTVADSTGAILSAPGRDGVNAAAGDARAEQTAAFEESLARSVQDMLTPLVGPGGAVVRVKADLDFDHRATTTERYEQGAQSATPVAESTTKETYTGTGTQVGGVLGPDPSVTIPNGGNNTYSKEQTQRTNAVGKVTETVEAAPGSVRRMSVAVLLNGTARRGLDEREVEDLVRAATLLDTERGDEIKVTTMSFDDTAAKAAKAELADAEAAKRRSALLDTIRTAGTLLAVGIGLAVLARRSRRPRRDPVPLPAGASLPALAAHEAAVLDEDGEPVAALVPAPGHPVLQDEIAELVDRQPEEVAQLLRGWLADRRS